MEKTQLTKKQIRDKIYYLKKTGQTSKYKRYLKQYRDYHSEDEEEKPEEENYSEEEENNTDDENLDNKFNLKDSAYNNIDEALKETLDKSQLEFLQSIFDNLIVDKNVMNNLYNYFKDRHQLKKREEKTQPNKQFYYSPMGF
jgi:hypothetical protein